MSRIHEALKKIERERARNGNGATSAEPELRGMPSEGSLADSAPLQSPSPRTSFVRPCVPSASAAETLSRCTQAAWHPLPAMLFLNGQPGILGNEEFRTLRSRLGQMQVHRNLQKLLISSPSPQEGKTFVAANLAQAMACQEGRMVLLIDGDLRRSTLHQCLGTFSKPGLSDYLQLESSIDEFAVMQSGPMKNLIFIPAGSTVPNPIELVGNGRLRKLLDHVEPLFDWIIVDSPPSTLVSDAALLADYCDGVLIVARSGTTRFDAMLRAKNEFGADKLIGAVLNGVPAASLPRYGAYPAKSADLE
jgi:capsular exopolysaccharide synthesis family protein